MAQPQFIRLGPCSVIYGGNDLGCTQNGVEITVKTTSKRIDIDHFGSVETKDRISSRMISIKTSLLEVVWSTLNAVFLNCGAVRNNGQVIIQQGFGTFLSTGGTSLVLHPLDRLAADYSEDIQFPNVTSNGNLTYSFKGDAERAFAVEFNAYPDAAGSILYFGQP